MTEEDDSPCQIYYKLYCDECNDLKCEVKIKEIKCNIKRELIFVCAQFRDLIRRTCK